MPGRDRVWSDERAEQIIGDLLLWGVFVSATVVTVAGIVFLARHGMTGPSYRVFRSEPSDLRGIRGILRLASTFRTRGLIQFGLLLLIATPIARVAFSVFAFFRERDWLYVGITLFVLATLLYSLVWSR